MAVRLRSLWTSVVEIVIAPVTVPAAPVTGVEIDYYD
jgi:hypothetical protein